MHVVWKDMNESVFIMRRRILSLSVKIDCLRLFENATQLFWLGPSTILLLRTVTATHPLAYHCNENFNNYTHPPIDNSGKIGPEH